MRSQVKPCGTSPVDGLLRFATLGDASRAHAERAHLHALAPERQAVALEILSRLRGE